MPRSTPADDPVAHAGAALGLPADGPGSLASWRARIAALLFDWAACMAAAVVAFGPGVLTGGGWRAWMILTLFFLESAILSALFQGSLGQIVARIAIVRLDRGTLGWRAFVRAALVSLALPALVVGPDRRILPDLICGTVVVSRR